MFTHWVHHGEIYAVIGFFILGWTVITTVIIMIFELLQRITGQISSTDRSNIIVLLCIHSVHSSSICIELETVDFHQLDWDVECLGDPDHVDHSLGNGMV